MRLLFLVLFISVALAGASCACPSGCPTAATPREFQYACLCSRDVTREAIQRQFQPSYDSDVVNPEAGSIYGYCACHEPIITGLAGQ